MIHNVVPLRAEPSGKSEQVSQAILGESVEAREERDGFLRIGTWDGYEGWALAEQLRAYAEGEPNWGASEGFLRVIAPICALRVAPDPCATIRTRLVFGASVRRLEATKGFVEVAIPSRGGESAGYLRVDEVAERASAPVFCGEAAAGVGAEWIGVPYLWGGATPFGFDCSGFVQRIYQHFGATLPRDAYQQATAPCLEEVALGEEIHAGDLLFFGGESDPRNRGITHVGMAIGGEEFIHASSRLGVARTPLNDAYYSRYLRAIRRYRRE